MRNLLALAALTLLAGMTLLVILAGRSFQLHPVIDTAVCRLPCWQHIQPGITPLVEADTRLIRLGYQLAGDYPDQRIRTYMSPDAACIVRLGYRQGIVIVTTLTRCQPLTMGDIMTLAGRPDSVSRLGTMFSFDEGRVLIAFDYAQCRHGLTPYTPVATLFLTQLPWHAAYTRDAVDGFAWRGFAPWWRYRQMNAGLYGC